MLSEPGASRSGNSGLVSSAKRRYLKLVHRKIPVSGHRSRTREPKLVHDTHSQLWDVVRRSRGPFTHLCRAERGRKSAKVTLSPAKTTVLPFHFWSERKGGFGLPLTRQDIGAGLAQAISTIFRAKFRLSGHGGVGPYV